MSEMTDLARAVNGARGGDAQPAKVRRMRSRRHDYIWDGREDPGTHAHMSIVAGRAATDLCLTPLQLRLLLVVGRYTGWVALDQQRLADQLGVRRQAVSTALSALADGAGGRAPYLERRTQAETG